MNTPCSSFSPLSWDPGMCRCGVMLEAHPQTADEIGAMPKATDRAIADAPPVPSDAEMPAGVRMIDAMNRALFPSLFGAEPKR